MQHQVRNLPLIVALFGLLGMGLSAEEKKDDAVVEVAMPVVYIVETDAGGLAYGLDKAGPFDSLPHLAADLVALRQQDGNTNGFYVRSLVPVTGPMLLAMMEATAEAGVHYYPVGAWDPTGEVAVVDMVKRAIDERLAQPADP